MLLYYYPDPLLVITWQCALALQQAEAGTSLYSPGPGSIVGKAMLGFCRQTF